MNARIARPISSLPRFRAHLAALVLIGTCLSALSSAQCTTTRFGPPNNSRYHRDAEIPRDLRFTWLHRITDHVSGVPVSCGNLLYIPVEKRRGGYGSAHVDTFEIAILDLTTGTERQRMRTPVRGQVLALVDELLVCGDGETIVAYRTDDIGTAGDSATPAWTVTEPGRHVDEMRGEGGVLLAVYRDTIRAYSMCDGQSMWHRAVPSLLPLPALHDGRVYCHSYSDSLSVISCLSLRDGAEVWSKELPCRGELADFEIPVVLNDGLLAPCGTGQWRMLSLGSGDALPGIVDTALFPLTDGSALFHIHIDREQRSLSWVKRTPDAPSLAWQCRMPEKTFGEMPVLTPQALFSVGESAVRIDPADGSVDWEYGLPGQESMPVPFDGGIAFVSQEIVLGFTDRLHPQLAWHYHPGVDASGMHSGARMYLYRDSTIEIVDCSNGKTMGMLETGPTPGNLRVSGDFVVVEQMHGPMQVFRTPGPGPLWNCAGGHVIFLDKKHAAVAGRDSVRIFGVHDGKRRCSLPRETIVYATVEDARALAFHRDSGLMLLDLTTGAPVWRNDSTARYLRGVGRVSGDTLAVVAGEDVCFYSAKDGRRLLSIYADEDHEITALALGARYVAIYFNHGRLECHLRRTGELVWRTSVDPIYGGEPLIAAKRVFIATEHRVLGFSIKNGEHVFSFETMTPPSPDLTVIDGNLVFSDRSSNVYGVALK